MLYHYINIILFLLTVTLKTVKHFFFFITVVSLIFAYCSVGAFSLNSGSVVSLLRLLLDNSLYDSRYFTRNTSSTGLPHPPPSLTLVSPGEPSAVRVPDDPPAQPQVIAADLTAGPGGDGLQERPQGSSKAAGCRPPALHCLPGPPAEKCRGLPPPKARAAARMSDRLPSGF